MREHEMTPHTRVVDRWHGQGAESAAWDACHAAAAVLRRTGLTGRYGMTVNKSFIEVARRSLPNYRTWEWRLVLVDRDPEGGPPPPPIAELRNRITI